MDRMGCWSSLPAGTSSAGQLENLRQVGKRSGILSKYGGAREWGVSPGVWSLTSWFFSL